MQALHLLLIILLLTIPSCTTTRTGGEHSQPDAAAAQAKLNREYLDPDTSILTADQRQALAKTGGLNFFPIDQNYAVIAKLERYPDPEIVQMPTSSDRLAEYRVYGQLSFELNGQPVSLDVFESTNPNVPEEYRDVLFLPFRDETSGSDTYGGGRYLDVRKPEGETVLLDFNRAYHPYCAYNYGYSCPVPPEQNFVHQRIEAGVRNTDLGE